MNLNDLKKHLRFEVVSATRTQTVDSFTDGCDPNRSVLSECAVNRDHKFRTIEEAFKKGVRPRMKQPFEISDIAIIDANSYIDRIDKNTGARKAISVVENHKQGIYRATFNRLETPDGRYPTEEEIGLWKEENCSLYLVDHDLYFRMHICCLDEGQVADLLGLRLA